MEERIIQINFNESKFDPLQLILNKIKSPGIWNMNNDHPSLIYDGVVNSIHKDGDKWVAEIINLSEVGTKALDKQKIPVMIPIFNVETGAFCEFNIVPEYFLNDIKPKQTKGLYKIDCDDTFVMDFIIVKAADEDDAWNIFWDKIIHDPNIDEYNFGEKENYRRIEKGYYQMNHGYKSISIDKVNLQNGYDYIGGGHIR